MKKCLFCIAIALFVLSCQREELIPLPNKSSTSTESGITLGAQLQNAYTVNNIRIAYRQVYPGTTEQEIAAITATHLYLRVWVNDSISVRLITEDTSIDAFPYPLDRELIGRGEYHPPLLERNFIYVVVPVGWPMFHMLNCTVLDSCFIPDEEDDKMVPVEQRALMNAGFSLVEEGTRVSGKPSGTISVWNTSSSSSEGVKGVKVVMNTLVRIKHEYTDNSGHYSCGIKFYTNVNYTLSFENRDFYRIWKDNLCYLPATMGLGVHHPNGYSYTMNTNSNGWQLSTIHNAAYIYYHTLFNVFHINMPPKNLRIWYIPIDINWGGSTPMWRHQIFDDMTFAQYMQLIPHTYGLILYAHVLPDMFLFEHNNTKSFYRTIFHELSHASHYVLAGKNYWKRYVENICSNLGYGNGTNHSEYIGVGEMWANYSEYRMVNYYWNTAYSIFPSLNIVPQSNEWYRPDILDSVVTTIPEVTFDTIFHCLTPTDSNFIELKKEIKLRTSRDYHPRIDSLFAPII